MSLKKTLPSASTAGPSRKQTPAATVTLASGASSDVGSGVLLRSGISAARVDETAARMRMKVGLRNMAAFEVGQAFLPAIRNFWQTGMSAPRGTILHHRRHGQADDDARSVLRRCVEEQIRPEQLGPRSDALQAKMASRNL